MRIGSRVRVVGRSLTFMGKKFRMKVGKITGRTIKHGVALLRVKFTDGEALYEEKDLEKYNG